MIVGGGGDNEFSERGEKVNIVTLGYTNCPSPATPPPPSPQTPCGNSPGPIFTKVLSEDLRLILRKTDFK